MDKDHILEEYPRPTLVRNQYTILNGQWEYAITSDNKEPLQYDGIILVPFSPECMLSGVNRILQPDEYLWYKRELFFEHISDAKRCILHFQAVDQYCEVYVNGQQVTAHLGGYLPFSADISEYIKTGANTLIVKVQDETDRGYHARGKQKLRRGGMFYTPQSGIWQTVWYEWVPTGYIKNMHIKPDARTGKVQFRFKPTSDKNRTYHIRITLKGKTVAEETRSTSSFAVTVPKHSVELWNLDHPVLYDVNIQANEDNFTSYFAFRTIELKFDKSTGKKLIHLNDKPCFLNGLLDQAIGLTVFIQHQMIKL